MYCPKCGAQLPDGSKFCSSCGTNMTGGEKAVLPSVSVKRKRKLPKVAIAVVLVGVLVFAGVKGIRGLLKGGEIYVYLKDGDYYLLTGTDPKDAFAFASNKGTNAEELPVIFSEDGKYVYYFSKYDREKETGTLCRAEYKKLKKDSAKNEKYIDIIDSNVKTGYEPLGKGRVIYLSGEHALYCYDGETSIRLAKDVVRFSLDEEGRMIYETSSSMDALSENSKSLYGVHLDDLENPVTLAEEYDNIENEDDFDRIVYVCQNGAYETDVYYTPLSSLYITGFDKLSEKIADNVTDTYYTEDKIMYVAWDGKEGLPYDCVEDEYLEQDAGMKKPGQEDYMIPVYDYEMLDEDSDIDDYETLYTSCTRKLNWLGGGEFTIETGIGVDWVGDEELVNDALQKFLDKYKRQENEEGVILVTEQVKEDLDQVARHNENYEPDDWKLFCLAKIESGKEFDYESYNKAQKAYKSISDRIELREALQDENYSFAIFSLYQYQDGNTELITDQVLSSANSDWTNKDHIAKSLAIILTDNIKRYQMDEINNVYEVIVGSEDVWSEPVSFVCTKRNEIIHFSEGSTIKGSKSIYALPEYVFVQENVEELLKMASVKDHTVEDFTILASDAKVFSAKDTGELYYAADMYEQDWDTYFDLHVFRDGDSTCIAKDVQSVECYEDGKLIGRSAYELGMGYELMEFDKNGNALLIEDGVYANIRNGNSNIIYTTDQGMYWYDGKEKIQLVSGRITGVWCPEAEDCDTYSVGAY